MENVVLILEDVLSKYFFNFIRFVWLLGMFMREILVFDENVDGICKGSYGFYFFWLVYVVF